jgi:hypothetical protein
MDKIAKKTAIKELEELKKELDGRKMSLNQLESHLKHLTPYNRTLYKSVERGILEVYYGSMTLRFYVKSGIISLDEKIGLWNENGIGYVGQFTLKTLQLESGDGLD